MKRGPGLVVRRGVAALGLVLSAGMVSCGEAEPSSSGPSVADDVDAVPEVDGAPSPRCLVRLHGKGGDGAETVVEGGVRVVAPAGNGEGWGGRQWTYFPDDDYQAAREVVAEATAGCQQVILNGFSNGGAFAAKLYCRGETFDGRLVGVVVDDPVVDEAVEGCAPDPGVAVTLYWTGALGATARPGWECEEGDWTCEGGRTIGIDAYAAAIGVPATDSPNDEHEWFLDAPELANWR